MKTLLSLSLIGSLYVPRQTKIGLDNNPDQIYGIYCITLLLYRGVLIPIILKSMGPIFTAMVTLEITFFLTAFFILISDKNQIDWLDRTKKKSLIVSIINLFPQKWEKCLLYFFFLIFEPLLLFVRCRNDTKRKDRFFLAWILLILSLGLAALIWLAIWSIF